MVYSFKKLVHHDNFNIIMYYYFGVSGGQWFVIVPFNGYFHFY